MEKEFWINKWEVGQIGFHNAKPHPFLIDNLGGLKLTQGSRIYLPLCGKTLDIAWLLQQGFRVVGVELAKKAIDELFEELQLNPVVTAIGELLHYQANNLDMYVGDVFALGQELLGPVDAIYDRAALVALPPDMRIKYTRHVIDSTQQAPQLLVTFEYDQSQMSGPPFSIPEAEVMQHYGEIYEITLEDQVGEAFRGSFPAIERVWSLTTLEKDTQ